MKKIATLKYKVDDSKTDIQGMLVVGIVVLGVALLLYTRALITGGLIFIAILIALRLYFIPSGELDFFYEEGNFYCKNKVRTEIESNQLKIKGKKFRWSYNFLGIPGNAGADVNDKSSAVNFPLLRMEIEFENGEQLILCHELGQWSSTPHWEYEHFIKEECTAKVLLVSSKLRKLKKEMETIEGTFG